MTAKRRHPRQSQGDSTHMLDEALFNAVNVLARPPELVLEVVESSVSAMLLVDLLFYVYAHGGRGAEKRPCSAATELKKEIKGHRDTELNMLIMLGQDGVDEEGFKIDSSAI
eukprot:scaffold1811_cov145-Skeletonema_menzelii.AAC.21